MASNIQKIKSGDMTMTEAEAQPPMSRVKNNALMGPELGRKFQKLHIAALVKYVYSANNKTINDDALELTTNEIVNNYYFFPVEVVALVLIEGFAGKYGKLFGAPGISELTQWLEAKWQSGQREREARHDDFKAQETGYLQGTRGGTDPAQVSIDTMKAIIESKKQNNE